MKRFLLIFTVIFMVVCLSGCAFWMGGERVSVTPYQEHSTQADNALISVNTYNEMNKALVSLVESGAQRGILTASSFSSGTLHYYVESAINNIMKSNPIGAYAVERIDYEIGTNSGVPVIAFDIKYSVGRSEILGIKRVDTMDRARELVRTALSYFDASVVLYVSNYSAEDWVRFALDYAEKNPHIVIEIPEVTANVYPEGGKTRVVEMTFTYQTSSEKLKEMQNAVAPVFTSAELYVMETAEVKEIYSRLYSFLMERNKYTIESSITPVYSLLHQGVGDSRAFADVYAEMCRRAELDCQTITGTRDGAVWSWNVVRYRGAYYHVDLLRCYEEGKFQLFRANDTVNYEWDYTAFPAE